MAQDTAIPKKEKIEFPEKKWGTYYDPKEIFCGKYDCYKILGFDFESWGRSPPSTKDITQSYRSLSRTWHPDKNRDAGANDRFLKISKAYKVLTDSKLRQEYDYLRERSDEYFYKYGSDAIPIYAPKTNVLIVVSVILGFICLLSWFAQKKKWQQVCDRLIHDAVEDLKVHEGGSIQSIEMREKAQTILQQKKEKELSENNCKNGEMNNQGSSSKSKVKLTKKELKDKEKEELRPIIQELVYNIQDFGAGFHKPTWRDIILIRMVYDWPIALVKFITWETKYYARRLRKFDLNDEERLVLTQRAVGYIFWETVSDAEKKDMIEKKLWIAENLEEWKDLRQMSTGDLKRYNRLKKKNKLSSDEWKEE